MWIALLAVFALLVPVSSASAGFSGEKLTIAKAADTSAVFPQIGTTPSGDSVVMWRERQLNDDLVLRFRRVHPDGSLGATKTVSDGAMLPIQWRLAVTSSGRALAVWTESGNGTAPLNLRARWINADDSLGDQVNVRDAAAGTSSASPEVVSASDGDAFVAWRNTKNDFSTVNDTVEALEITADGTKGSLLETPDGPGSSTVALAPNATGGALMVWTGDPATIYAVKIDAAGAIGTVQKPVIGGVISTPALSTDGHDNFHILWQPIGETESMSTRQLGVIGGPTGDREAVDTLQTGEGRPFIATNSANRSVAAWARGGLTSTTAARLIDSEAHPESTVFTAPADDPQFPQGVALRDDGVGVLVYTQRRSDGFDGLWTREVGPGATAKAPVELVAKFVNAPALDINGKGLGTLVWGEKPGTNQEPVDVFARRYAPDKPATPAPVTPIAKKDTVKPIIRSFKINKKRTAFTARISEAAKVTVTIQRKRGKRFKKVRTLRTKRASTKATLKLGKRKLKAGSYRATAVATDAAGNKSKAKRIKFKVKKRSAKPRRR